jgi:hypothetical protein
VIVKDAICFRNTSGRSSPRRRRTRRSRSHARWAGRAAARPQSKLRCGGGERATFGSGGARKYGCNQTGCGGLSVVEQPASLIGALNSPHDKSADERQGLETKPISRGTESSNPVPSTGESANHRSLNIGRGSAPTRREGPISYDERDRERATRQALAPDTVACVNQLRWFGDLLARLRLTPTRRVAWLRSPVHDELW